MKNPPNMRKRGAIWYYRDQSAGHDRLISTHKKEKAAAIEAAAQIRATIERERSSRRFSAALIEVAKGMARHDLTVEAARDRLATIENEAAAEVFPSIDAMIPAPPLSPTVLWDRYMATSPKLERSTLNTKKQRFFKFAAYAEKMDVSKFDRTEALRFLRSLGAEKAQTWKNYISDLSSVWQASPDLVSPWTADLRKVASATKKAVEHKAFLSIDEMRKIKAYIEGRIAAAKTEKERGKYRFWHFFMILSFHCFCRLTDVVHASAFSVRSDGYFDFSPLKTDSRTGNRKVAAEIRPQLKAELESLTPGKDGYYFPDYAARYDARETGRNAIDKEFTDILRACGFYRPGFGCHSMRHGGITLAIDAGNDVEEVAAVAGHDSVSITQGTYYHGRKKTHLDNYPDL